MTSYSLVFWIYVLTYQIVVTNCKNWAAKLNSNRKSWNWILISVDILSAYYVDSQYIAFIKLSFTHKRLGNFKNLADFWKREETPIKSQRILIKIKPLDMAY